MKYHVWGEALLSLEVDAVSREEAREAWERFVMEFVDRGARIEPDGRQFSGTASTKCFIRDDEEMDFRVDEALRNFHKKQSDQ